MSDLIRREDAVRAIYNHFLVGSMYEARKILHEVPAAGQQTGGWIPQDFNKKSGTALEYITTCVAFMPKCSECGKSGDFAFDFCPNCGAKMEGVNEQTA